MQVKQIYEIINSITSEVLGKTDLVKEDLTNIVDVGNELFNATAVDNYVRKLVDHIGKVIFVNRTYKGTAPSILMNGWEFGSVLEKIQIDLPEASENESWDLQDGTSYDPNIFYKPKVSAKFFNSKITFEIPVSITEKQVKESFDNAVQLNAFISMIYGSVEKSLTVKMDSLIMRTINNMIGDTVYGAYAGGSVSTDSKVRAVNLLYLYNQTVETPITKDVALHTPEFIKFATYTMGLYKERMGRMSTLFNGGGKERFTPSDMLHVVLLNDFAKASDVYLQSDTYHNEMVKLPNYEVTPYWQGTGLNYGFDDVSKINITTSSGNSVEYGGILGIMFDRDALGVANLERRTTTNYNAKGEFFNEYFKFDAGYFNDFNENFVVFLID